MWSSMLSTVACVRAIAALHAAIAPAKSQTATRNKRLFYFLCGLTSETPCVASFPECGLGGKRKFGTIIESVIVPFTFDIRRKGNIG